MACINHHFFYFPEKSTGAFVTTMHDSNDHQNDSDNGFLIPEVRGIGRNTKRKMVLKLGAVLRANLIVVSVLRHFIHRLQGMPSPR
jgi:hypothetical protein